MLNLLQQLKDKYKHRSLPICQINKVLIGRMFVIPMNYDDSEGSLSYLDMNGIDGEIYMVIHDPFAPEDKEHPEGIVAVALNSSYICEFPPNKLVGYLPNAGKHLRGFN